MATDRQIAANRRNAAKSTGPRTAVGKRRSRANALQHGLSAETVVPRLEDADTYRAFEASIAADYDPQTAIERHLVARLASLLWRLRRASLIETGLFEIQGRILSRRRHLIQADSHRADLSMFHRYLHQPPADAPVRMSGVGVSGVERCEMVPTERRPTKMADVASAYLRLCNLNNDVLERLGRYETTLWRQAAQVLMLLEVTQRNKMQSIAVGRKTVADAGVSAGADRARSTGVRAQQV